MPKRLCGATLVVARAASLLELWHDLALTVSGLQNPRWLAA